MKLNKYTILLLTIISAFMTYFGLLYITEMILDSLKIILSSTSSNHEVFKQTLSFALLSDFIILPIGLRNYIYIFINTSCFENKEKTLKKIRNNFREIKFISIINLVLFLMTFHFYPLVIIVVCTLIITVPLTIFNTLSYLVVNKL